MVEISSRSRFYLVLVPIFISTIQPGCIRLIVWTVGQLDSYSNKRDNNRISGHRAEHHTLDFRVVIPIKRPESE